MPGPQNLRSELFLESKNAIGDLNRNPYVLRWSWYSLFEAVGTNGRFGSTVIASLFPFSLWLKPLSELVDLGAFLEKTTCKLDWDHN